MRLKKTNLQELPYREITVQKPAPTQRSTEGMLSINIIDEKYLQNI